MKKNWLVKFIFVFALLLAFSQAAIAAAPNAANADAEVGGLWLTCPTFPAGAEVLEFDNDTEMEIVQYIRGLDDGKLTFEIRRQTIADSELQSPEDVAGLIEKRVNYDDIDEESMEENIDSIDVTEDAEDFAKLLTYPCAAAEYATGAGENARRNAALFIFTDVYCFEVNISMADDSAGDYTTGPMQDWFVNLRFVENESGGEADDPAADAKAADADVTGLWLEIPAFPKDAEAGIDISDDGTVVYMRTLEDGAFGLTITRIPNPDNGITTENVGTFISGFSGVSEDDLDINVAGPDDEPLLTLAGEYPSASVQYDIEDEGVTKQNMDLCFFPDEFFLWVHMEVTDEDVMKEKYEDDVEGWYRSMRIVER